MCFSPTASFVASGVLSGLGGASLKLVKDRKELMVAFTPVLFAIQQFAEGIVWVTSNSIAHQIAIYAFLIFALVIWPVYVPVAVYLMETDKKRRPIQKIIALVGAGVAFILLLSLFSTVPTAEVVGHSIQYNYHPVVNGELLVPFYVLATVGSLLYSSYKLAFWGGWITFASVITAAYFYTQTFESVWCYFAAVISSLIYFYFRFSRKKK